MERGQASAARAAPSTLSTADRARELWRMKMGAKSHVVIPTTPQTMQSRQRGSSVGVLTNQSQQRSPSDHRASGAAVYKRRQGTSQARPRTKAEPLGNEEEYYGGESLWCEDIQEEISTVSYRATRMTESVKRLFAEISSNARPLRRGDTRDLIYLAKERYEKEMEADCCILHTSKSAPRPTHNQPSENANVSVDDDTARDSQGCTASRTSSTKSRSASKQAVLRDKLELFPRSRAGSRVTQTGAEQSEQDAGSLTDRAAPAGNTNGDTKSSAHDRTIVRDEGTSPLELTFKKAFLYAKHHLSQWIRHSRE